MDSLLAEQFIGMPQGVHFLVLWETGSGSIGLGRNRLARNFLDIPEAECIVFVDSDISWTGGELAKLAKRPEDVIGATYRPKIEIECYHIDGKPEPVGDLYRVDGLPGGFIKMSRKAFESIPANAYADGDGKEWVDYFPTGFHRGRMYGEDYGFCRQWRDAGGTVFLDPSIKLRHHDGSRAFEGDPKAWIEAQQWP